MSHLCSKLNLSEQREMLRKIIKGIVIVIVILGVINAICWIVFSIILNLMRPYILLNLNNTLTSSLRQKIMASLFTVLLMGEYVGTYDETN